MEIRGFIVRAQIDKPIEVESILPDEIENYPWAGHLGLKLIHKVLPILEQSRTTPDLYQYPRHERGYGISPC